MNGLRVLGVVPFDPVHIRILILAVEDFPFPFLHPIEEYLQTHSADGAGFVEIPVWTAVRGKSYRTHRL